MPSPRFNPTIDVGAAAPIHDNCRPQIGAAVQEAAVATSNTSTAASLDPSSPVGAPRRRQEDYVADAYIPCVMALIAGEAAGGVAKVKAWRDQMIVQSGCADDPVLQMLIEGACVAHLAALKLYALAVQNKEPATVAVYAGAAARVAAEQRRTLATIKACQRPAPATVVSIAQQNVAERQTVSYAASGADAKMVSHDEVSSDPKLVSNDGEKPTHESEITRTSGRWQSESTAGQAAERRRPTAVA